MALVDVHGVTEAEVAGMEREGVWLVVPAYLSRLETIEAEARAVADGYPRHADPACPCSLCGLHRALAAPAQPARENRGGDR